MNTKLRIFFAIILMAIIPALYMYGVGHGSGGGGRSGGGSRGFSGGHGGAGRTGGVSTMHATRSATAGRSVRPSTRATTTSRRTAQNRSTKVAGAGRGGRHDRHGGRHGDHWGHRREFRNYPGNFWSLGIGYPWWWYNSSYSHICVDEFGFEYPFSYCYSRPNLYFWWYR